MAPLEQSGRPKSRSPPGSRFFPAQDIAGHNTDDGGDVGKGRRRSRTPGNSGYRSRRGGGRLGPPGGVITVALTCPLGGCGIRPAFLMKACVGVGHPADGPYGPTGFSTFLEQRGVSRMPVPLELDYGRSRLGHAAGAAINRAEGAVRGPLVSFLWLMIIVRRHWLRVRALQRHPESGMARRSRVGCGAPDATRFRELSSGISTISRIIDDLPGREGGPPRAFPCVRSLDVPAVVS